MDLQKIVEQGPKIEAIVEGTGWRMEEFIEELLNSGDWDLAGRYLICAAEIPARKIAEGLIEKQAYLPLAIAGCLRRQVRRGPEGGGGGGGKVASRIFRDIDADSDGPGVPDHIREDMEEMAKSAASTRATAAMRDASIDRDPIRHYIVERLAGNISKSEEAMDALVAIARASAWEETRRTAALKVANDPISVSRLARSMRTEDILDIARAALLEAVKVTFAKEMGRNFKAYSDARDAKALRLIAEHHPDDQYKDSARQWAEAIEKAGGQ